MTLVVLLPAICSRSEQAEEPDLVLSVAVYTETCITHYTTALLEQPQYTLPLSTLCLSCECEKQTAASSGDDVIKENITSLGILFPVGIY